MKGVSLTRPQKVNRSKIRVPTTNFELKQRPWQIQPFCIFPVLPGEMLKKMLWTDTAITDPLLNRFLGWHCETKFFYVRARDTIPASSETIKSIFIDPDANLSSLYEAADVKYFHKYGVNWCKNAVRQIVENYYRAEDEAPDDYTIDGMWAATVGTDNWTDSMILGAQQDAEDVSLTVGVDDAIGMKELNAAQRMYQFLKMGLLTDMDYSDFLRTYGVKIPAEELPGKPKYLGGVSEWTMPTNTVEPTTGVATTACYWQNKDRLDQDHLFKEPGFVVGLRVYRPKIFRAGIQGSVSGIMDTALEWLPAVLMDDPDTSLTRVASGAGPLGALGQDYTFDMRDYFLYGEEFMNFDPSTWSGAVALPAVETAPTPDRFNKRYPSLAMAKQLFVDATADVKTRIETSGRIDLTIAGRIIDTTPAVARLEV
ncbi:putative major capsid protein [Rhizobium phage RHph_N39]|nr:putative major capsid protein [Rhizobium phage RHph_N39]